SAHPRWLVERWVRSFGLATARQICHQGQAVPKTAFHLSDNNVAEELDGDGVSTTPGVLLSSARQIVAGDVTKTNAFRDGRLHIQDEASQLVALLAGTGNSILDCCAAPGGQTMLLA